MTDQAAPKMVNAADPAMRDKLCLHKHLAYRARFGMPCTGPTICSMCGSMWDEREDALAARDELARNLQVKGGEP